VFVDGHDNVRGWRHSVHAAAALLYITSCEQQTEQTGFMVPAATIQRARSERQTPVKRAAVYIAMCDNKPSPETSQSVKMRDVQRHCDVASDQRRTKRRRSMARRLGTINITTSRKGWTLSPLAHRTLCHVVVVVWCCCSIDFIG